MMKMHLFLYVVWIGLSLSACNNFVVNRRPDLTPGPVDSPGEPNVSVPMPDDAVLMPPEPELAKNIDLENDPIVPPGVYRIKGTVLQVYPIRKNDTNTCALAPCLTAVRVDTIMGRGADTRTGLLKQGQRIDVFFRYSTAPTAKLFPEVQPALPGVSNGTPFSADIAVAPESTGSRTVFELYEYTIPE